MISMVVTPLMREFEPDHRPSLCVAACGEAGGKNGRSARAPNPSLRIFRPDFFGLVRLLVRLRLETSETFETETVRLRRALRD
jgi:hypothetical protein